jgi:hypothetical protein
LLLPYDLSTMNLKIRRPSTQTILVQGICQGEYAMGG